MAAKGGGKKRKRLRVEDTSDLEEERDRSDSDSDDNEEVSKRDEEDDEEEEGKKGKEKNSRRTRSRSGRGKAMDEYIERSNTGQSKQKTQQTKTERKEKTVRERMNAIQFRDDPPPAQKRAKASAAAAKLPSKLKNGPTARPASKRLGPPQLPAKPSSAQITHTAKPLPNPTSNVTKVRPKHNTATGPSLLSASAPTQTISTAAQHRPSPLSRNTKTSLPIPQGPDRTANKSPSETQQGQLTSNSKTGPPRGPLAVARAATSQPITYALYGRSGNMSASSRTWPDASGPVIFSQGRIFGSGLPFPGNGEGVMGQIGGQMENHESEEFFSNAGRQPPSSLPPDDNGIDDDFDGDALLLPPPGQLFQAHQQDHHERIGRVQEGAEAHIRRASFNAEMEDFALTEIALDPEADEDEEGPNDLEARDLGGAEEEAEEDELEEDAEEMDLEMSEDADHGGRKQKKGSRKVARVRSASAYPEYKAWLMKTARRARSIVVTLFPMATPEEEDEAIQTAWKRATVGGRFVNKPFPDKFSQIVRQHFPSTRSRLKGAAAYQVSEDFGLKSSKRKRENRQIYLHLIEDDRYTHERPDEKKNRWFSHTAVTIIRKTFFGDRKADGFTQPDLFNPIPLPLMALTFTAIRCALDEWARGKHEPVQFRVSEYEAIYEGHAQNLLALAVGNNQAMQKIQEWYWKRATGSKYQMSGQSGSKAMSDTQLKDTIADALARQSSDVDMESELSESEDD